MEIVKGLGFLVGYSEEFSGHNDQKDTIFFMYHPDFAVLLIWETYGKSVSSAKIMYSIRFDDIDNTYTSSGGWDNIEKNEWSGNHDAREAIAHKFNSLKERGEFIDWPEFPFVWGVTYMDKNQPDFDYEALTYKRMENMPDSFLKRIQFQRRTN